MTTTRSYGLPSPLVRHAIIVAVAAGAVLVQGSVFGVGIDTQTLSWLALAVGVGVLAAILARGPIGVLFVAFGFVLGVGALFALRGGATDAVAEIVRAQGLLYAAVVLTAVAAYAVTAGVISLARRPA